jgi:hypothetical protein
MEDGARFNGNIQMNVPSPVQVAPEPEEVTDELDELEELTA